MTTIRDNPQLDPYLKWGLDTGFQGFKQPKKNADGKWVLPVVLELRDPVPPPMPSTLPVEVPWPWPAPPRGTLNIHPQGYLVGSRYVNVDISEDLLEWILGYVRRLKLGLPSAPNMQAPSPLYLPPGHFVPPPVIGFVDHGMAFLNTCFRDSHGVSRIFSFWDQEDCPTLGNPWGASEFRYGRELYGSGLAAWLAGLEQRVPGMSEDEVYGLLGYDACRKRVGHGTHVMDLAAGFHNPVKLAAGENPANTVDTASGSPIIAVQLPYKPFKDTSSSSLCVHLLDALRYIVSKVRDPLQRIVINISDGAYAGSHDGNSLLESAIDEFLTKHTHVTLVIAAGNGFEQRLHARSTVQHPAPLLQWRVLPDILTDSFMELWLKDAGAASIKVTAPDGTAYDAVNLDSNKVLYGPDGTSILGAIYSTRNGILNGSARGMFLLALAPTREKVPDMQVAAHGVWSIAVGGTQEFDAYVQRNNPALGDKGPRRQSFFVDTGERPDYVTGKGTLNNIATGERPAVVGGFYRQGSVFNPSSGTSHRVAPYSSAGPGRKGPVQGVNVHAISEESPALHGLLASGVRSGTRIRMGGTSVAAPVATRILVNGTGSLPFPNSEHLLPPSADDRPG